ncbi:MAG: carbon-nitrogen hydrolase family protein [Phycisphaerales bacterium]
MSFSFALISDVFHQQDGADRLRAHLATAKKQGASLAVLPELPCNPWSPATKTPRDDDAETLESGGRVFMQADAAREAGIALLGGILQKLHDGTRRNTAILFNQQGQIAATYSKMHLPEEPGFWETSHYEAGNEPPRAISDVLPIRVGMQICSDINRPEGCHLLGADGAQLILAPRATEQATWQRWRPVLMANAVTSCAFVASVNRPREEQGVLIGGPSFVVTPNLEVLLESTDTVATVTIDTSAIEHAKVEYPGYLPVRADVYARAWQRIADRVSEVPRP